jgi:hypothetical protein
MSTKSYPYIAQIAENNSALQRKIERVLHDPNRYYEGENLLDKMPVIKAVRVG